MRGLHPDFDTPFARTLLSALSWLQNHLRHWKRKQNGGPSIRGHWPSFPEPPVIKSEITLINCEGLGRHELYRHLLSHGWQACPNPDFDLQRDTCKLLAATEQTGTPVNRTFIALSEAAPDLCGLAESDGFKVVHKS
jgi:hypothetical protein